MQEWCIYLPILDVNVYKYPWYLKIYLLFTKYFLTVFLFSIQNLTCNKVSNNEYDLFHHCSSANILFTESSHCILTNSIMQFILQKRYTFLNFPTNVLTFQFSPWRIEVINHLFHIVCYIDNICYNTKNWVLLYNNISSYIYKLTPHYLILSLPFCFYSYLLC